MFIVAVKLALTTAGVVRPKPYLHHPQSLNFVFVWSSAQLSTSLRRYWIRAKKVPMWKLCIMFFFVWCRFIIIISL